MTTIFKDAVVFETYGETISAGQPLYKSTGTGSDSGRTAGRLYLLDVSNSDRKVFYGIAKDAGVAADLNKRVINAGRAEGFTGLTAGLPVYAGATAGSYTQVPPTSNIQVLGIAQDADTLLVNAALAGSFLSSTGGGGVSDLYVLFQDDFETSILADYTQTGLTLSAASPLHGAISALLTSHASINQSFGRTYAVPEEFRNKNLTIKLNIKSAATAGNVTINVYDVTNSANIVASQALELSSAIGGVLTSVSFDVPETCASFSYTITALPEAGSPATRVDDITCEITSVAEYSAVVQETDSMVRVDTSNGFGSTGTAIRRFTNLRESIGSDILYQDSAVSGASFTALVSGTYDITFTEVASAVTVCGLTKNAPSLSTGITSTAIQFVLASDVISANAYSASVAWQGYLQAGDVVRAHTNGVSAATNGTITSQFTMSRQGSLKVASVNSDQKITIPTSELRFEGASSRGAVATAIVKFDTMAKIRGDAFTVVSTANDGTMITMKKAGKLSISASLLSGDVTYYLSKNQAVLTSSAPSASETLSVSSNAAVRVKNLTWTGDVVVGDTIRVSGPTASSPTTDAGNSLNLSFQEQSIQVSVSNTLPQFSESDSSVRVDTGNGYGSTANKIRRFSNVRDNIGTDVTYADSATAGSSFTAKVSGTYEISYSDIFSGAGFFGLSKNASSLTTGLSSLAATERLVGATAAAGSGDNVSWQGYLVQGDIVRPHTDGGTPGGETLVNFTMSKVGKPNVTGVNVTPFIIVPFEKASVGEIQAYAGSIDGEYFLPCDGTAVNRGTYSQLFAKIGITHGQGDGSTTFNVPDYRGRFLRGVTGASALDPDAASRTAMATGGNTGNNVGSVQSDQYQSHTHGQTGNTVASGGVANAAIVGSGSQTTVNTTQASGGNETRPENAYVNYGIRFKTATDAVLTVPETFSSDTAALTYGDHVTYPGETALASAPVGTLITYVYTLNSNSLARSTSAPTQTTSDMNANGILIYTRAFNAASTAALPARVAIQIGKGLKGVSLNLFKSAGKVTSGSLDYYGVGAGNEFSEGMRVRDYNEVTGILILDAGQQPVTVTSGATFNFSDTTSQTSGYLVINASKNPALVGMNLNRAAGAVTQTSGQTFTSGTTTKVVWNSSPEFAEGITFDSSNNRFRVLSAGVYDVGALVLSAAVTWSQSNQMQLLLYKNGALVKYLDQDAADTSTITRNMTVGGSCLVKAAANDYFELYLYYERPAGTMSLSTGAGANYFNIAKQGI